MIIVLPFYVWMMYCVPDLYFDGEVIDDCVSGAEFDAKGGFVVLLESVLGES